MPAASAAGSRPPKVPRPEGSAQPGGDVNSEEPEAELAVTVKQHGRCDPLSPADQEELFERDSYFPTDVYPRQTRMGQ